MVLQLKKVRPVMPPSVFHRPFMDPLSRASGLGLAALALAACQPTTPPIPPGAVPKVELVEDGPMWRAALADDDFARIEDLDRIWAEAIERAGRGGFARQMAREEALLDPFAALPRPSPTPGNYMCRLVRFGSGEPRTRAYTAYREHFCHIGTDGDLLSLTKQTGSDRPGGYLFDREGADHMIFLGSLALGDEAPLAYGDDPDRDMAGRFERIGPFRFRLVVPYPRFGVLLEVMELTPAPVQND